MGLCLSMYWIQFGVYMFIYIYIYIYRNRSYKDGPYGPHSSEHSQGPPYDPSKLITHSQSPYRHWIPWICMDLDELDCWIEGQFFLFDIKSLKSWTMDEEVRDIRLTSNLICRLAPLGSFGPPPSHDQWGLTVGPTRRSTLKPVRTILNGPVMVTFIEKERTVQEMSTDSKRKERRKTHES